MKSFIAPEDVWSLWAVIVVGTATAIWLEQTSRWAAKLSGPVLALVIAMTLSNTGVMPTEAPSYAFVGDFLVPLAIPLLMLRANLFRIARETGWMFVAFHISMLGTILGAALAVVLMQGKVEPVADIAGIMTASYVGGAINFFAVRESLSVSENITNPLLVADNFIMAAVMLILLAIPGNAWFRRHFRTSQSSPEQEENAAADHWRPKSIGLLDIAKCFAVSLTLVACARYFSDFAVRHWASPGAAPLVGNLFVWITLLTMIVATACPRLVENINGAEELGVFMLYIFLFAIGLPADILTVLYNVPLLFVFCLIMAVTNLAVTLVLGKLFRINLEDLLICVSATLGGPSTAAALAIAKGWPNLIVPAVLVGIWGYVVGTFLGILVAEMAPRLL